MSNARSCEQCGTMLPDDSPHGVCPNCLMRIGLGVLESATQAHQAGHQPFVPPQPHQLAAHFPQLEILDLIGQGGMGAVYKARQVGLDRIVALKILPPHSRDDGSFAGRFEREARALARLNHPNIVSVYDSGRAGEFYYFVMEFVDGVNLREALNAEALTPAEALSIVPQLCDALQYAHDEGIVHRDIKPENVLIDKKGNTMIADFGLARLLGPTTDATLTGTHQVMGTPRYMAPEQMEGSHAVDHRADIYSLGVVFYEMLTGELPLGRFDGPSKKARVDARLDAVVFRTLEKEPGRRYQHASEIKTDVQTISGAFAGARHHPRYEYKSKTQLFGWPLVHVAFGTDPKTGKLLRAKGIIAIGSIAYGVIAIGSFAVGGIAIGAGAVGGLAIGGGAVGSLALGGGALGLFTCGGLSLGLLMAFGGVAVSLGLSLGGVAFGTIAIGGVGVGRFVSAPVALGAHVLDHTGIERDTAAESLFNYLAEVGMGSILVGLILMGLLSVCVGLVISIRLLRRTPEPIDRPTVPPKAPRFEPQRSSSGPLVVVGLVISFAALCILPLLLLGWYFSTSKLEIHRIPQPVVSASSDASFATVNNAAGPEVVGWTQWTADGPELRPDIEFENGLLSTEQRTRINDALRQTHTDYIELEEKHRGQTRNEMGRITTQVRIHDANKVSELESQLWSVIDATVDADQLELIRKNLLLKPAREIGLLGFPEGHGEIEIWKVGAWYFWSVRPSVRQLGPPEATPSFIPGPGIRGSGPRLPYRYQRFWSEPATSK